MSCDGSSRDRAATYTPARGLRLGLCCSSSGLSAFDLNVATFAREAACVVLAGVEHIVDITTMRCLHSCAAESLGFRD